MGNKLIAIYLGILSGLLTNIEARCDDITLKDKKLETVVLNSDKDPKGEKSDIKKDKEDIYPDDATQHKSLREILDSLRVANHSVDHLDVYHAIEGKEYFRDSELFRRSSTSDLRLSRSFRGDFVDEYARNFSPGLWQLLESADYIARSNAHEIPVIGNGVVVGATFVSEGKRLVDRANRKLVNTSNNSIDFAKDETANFLADRGVIGEPVRDYLRKMRVRTILGLISSDAEIGISGGIFFEGDAWNDGNFRIGFSYGGKDGGFKDSGLLLGYSWTIGPRRIR